MTFSPALHVLRVKLTTVALGGIVLTGSHAVARNHDCQAFKLPSTPLALHDRAPGPSLRNAD